MDELRQRFRERLAARTAALRAAVSDLEAAPEESTAMIRRIAHALHGSGGTYGFPQISDAARVVEYASDSDLTTAVDELLRILDFEEKAHDKPATRLLLVDDDDQNLLLLQAIVDPLNAHVTCVGSAADARRILSEESFSLVVLDLMLPDADGRTVLLWMREQQQLAEVPVFVMSGLGSGRVQAECYAIGADGFFEKPIDPDVVRAAIASRMGARRAERTDREPAPPAVVDAPGGRRVILVEDDDLTASIIRHRLSRAGFDVVHFDDGVAARDNADAADVCLAILDIKIPGIDGFELMENLRARPEFARIPFIILTALGSERDVVRGLNLGASDYIVKPFSPTELVARVNRLTQPT